MNLRPATNTSSISLTVSALISLSSGKGVLTTPKSISPARRSFRVSGVGALATLTLMSGYRSWNSSRKGNR